MSVYWDVHCVTCDVGLGLHGNHQEDPANAIARDATKIADASRLIPGLRIPHEETYGFYSERGSLFDAAWFEKHRGHQIVARNEYGAISTKCGEWVACPTCAHRFTCNRDVGHNDERGHSPEPDKT